MANFIYIEALAEWYIAKFGIDQKKVMDGSDLKVFQGCGKWYIVKSSNGKTLYLNKQGIWTNSITHTNNYYYDTKEEAQAVIATALNEDVKPDYIVGVS